MTMSQADEEDGYIIRTLASTFTTGTLLDSHTHDWGQLIYAMRGVMTIEAAAGCWVVPAHRAVWVPPAVPHTVAMSGSVAMRTLYVAPGTAATLPRDCRAFNVSPLLRELIVEATRVMLLHRDRPEHARLAGVILDQLAVIEATPLRLPMPEHKGLREIAERLRASPDDDVALATVAARAHMSTRSFERRFRAETGLPFVQWRQRMRLLHALRLLAGDTNVTEAALAVGYSSTSAFIAAFKRELGTTPSQYYAKPDD